MPERVLVTGACGFVGRVLCKQLCAAGYHVVGVTRRDLKIAESLVSEVDEWKLADFAFPDKIDWQELLHGCNRVVHLAAKVHVLYNATPHEAALYHTINYVSTMRLASAAAQAKLERFVFVSSVKAATASVADKAGVTVEDDPYGTSKREAELALIALRNSTHLPVVILRPPLVYGPGVKANFARLLQLARWRVPVPFSGIHNQRSLIFVENLASAIRLCLTHPAADGQMFTVTDVTVSTPILFRAMSSAFGVEPRMFHVSVNLLRQFAKLVRREAEVARLIDSLTVDGQRIRDCLGWQPSVPFEDGLKATAQAFTQRDDFRK